MLKTITTVPQNEYDLVKLKEFIGNHDNMLDAIAKKIQKINAFLEMLEIYCFKYDVINSFSYY